MFTLSSSLRYHLYAHPTDMRNSFDGLSGIIRNELDGNPCSGDVFIFINRTRDRIKLLHWQDNGFTLYYKRLEEGTFEPFKYDFKQESITLSYPQLVMLIDGLSIKNIQQRKRFSLPAEPVFTT